MSQVYHEDTQSMYRQAFEQVKAEVQAVNEAEFVPITLDIAATVITVQGAHPAILALRADFVQHLPTFAITKVDQLETYALAMFCAQADYKAATEPPASRAQLANSAVKARAVLLADVNSLIAHGLLAPSVIAELQGVNGYKNVMMDVGTLASILRTHATRVAPRTSIKPDELAAAEDLANRLGKAVGLREQSPQVVAEAARNRKAAYALLVRTYEDVRAAVRYLRRKAGDADTIAPSLCANRGLRKKSSDSRKDKPQEPSPASPGADKSVSTLETGHQHG